MRIVKYVQLENSDGSLQLCDLYRDDFTLYQTPFLVFKTPKGKEKCWDNDSWLFEFFRGLEKNKKKHIKELEKFCKKYKFDFEYTLEDLLEMYENSKKLGLWKK